MKKNFVCNLVLLLLSSFAAATPCADDFFVGYVCESFNGQSLLIQNIRSHDHGLDVCESLSMENFGFNSQNCIRAANSLNGRARKYGFAPLLQDFAQCGDYHLRADERGTLFFIRSQGLDYPASHQLLSSSEYEVDLHQYSAVTPQGRIEFTARTRLNEERKQVLSVSYSAVLKAGSKTTPLSCRP